MNPLIPELIVSDLQRSLNFYCQVLGFKIEYQKPEDKFAFLSYHGSQLMLEEDYEDESPWRVGPLERPFGRGMNLSIECPDCEGLSLAIENAGYTLRKSIEERWYRDNDVMHGQLNFLVLDPDGYLLWFNQNLGSKAV